MCSGCVCSNCNCMELPCPDGWEKVKPPSDETAGLAWWWILLIILLCLLFILLLICLFCACVKRRRSDEGKGKWRQMPWKISKSVRDVKAAENADGMEKDNESYDIQVLKQPKTAPTSVAVFKYPNPKLESGPRGDEARGFADEGNRSSLASLSTMSTLSAGVRNSLLYDTINNMIQPNPKPSKPPTPHV